jgi:transcriptional regulator with XRE-family HTH domain
MRQWREKLREQFALREIKYADAAERCGVATSTVGAWMSGRNEPPIEQLRKLAELAGVTVSWLLEDDPLYAATAEERAMLALFRQIGQGQRNAALTLIRGVAEAAPDYQQPETLTPYKAKA